MKLAVIGTFHGRLRNTSTLFHRVMIEQTRVPDEFWVVCEDDDDVSAALTEYALLPYELRDIVKVQHLPTPKVGGKYEVIPYSRKINMVLDTTDAELICYLDNGSMPARNKYEIMAAKLEAHPEYHAVYCGQHRYGFREDFDFATAVVDDGYSRLNYTQVMHRPTDARWPLDMKWADPDLADAIFWRELGGPFHPAGMGTILDDHFIPSPKAAGL